MSALDLLSGDAQVFLEKTWASRTHLHRAEPADLVALLSLEDVDELLTSSGLRTPALRLAKEGEVLPESAYTRRGATLAGKPLTGLVDARRVLQLFDEGASIVLQGLHRYWPPLTRLIAELELELGHPCQANAYLTPPGSQGFALHADTHDVFVFQTAGAKQWEVHGEDGPQEIRLEPGLSMYLPTGTRHAARAQESVSLHVTIGINQLTWRGLARRALEAALDEVPDEHLPAGYLDDPSELTSGLASRLAALADRIRAIDPAEPVADEIRRFLTSRPSRLSGGLSDVIDLRSGLTEDSVLRRRAGHPCVLLDRDGQLQVLLGDRSLTMPARLRPAMEEVRARASFGPSDLGLDPQSGIVLCTRLVREGLLEVVGPQPR
ncbi:MAG TPA: cupin domain-containing protein [Aeromicrobium sp.]|nr:cupin domain-containing protein [Aeromicrobium sp.]